jgi:putative copper export protein
VVVTITDSLQPGDYTVAWQAAGDDGHPVRGRFAFVIAPGAKGVGAPANADDSLNGAPPREAHHNPVTMPTGEGFGAESAGYVLVRWAGFIALLVIIGAVAFRQVVLRAIPRVASLEDREAATIVVFDAARRAARYAYWAALALCLVLVARLLAQSAALHGEGGLLDLSLIGAMLRKTVWGWGWQLQATATLIVIVGFRAAIQVKSAPERLSGWTTATVGAVLLAFSPAFAGHAAAAPRWLPLTVLADGLHVLGASGWLGSLTMVIAAGLPAALAQQEERRGRAVSDMINAFSPTALVFAGLVAATGVFAAWMHVGSIPALWQTRYGKILLAKLAVLSIVALTGAYNWLRVRPTLGQVEGAVRIRRSSTVELAVGIIVLLLTAILVATPTPLDMAGMAM